MNNQHVTLLVLLDLSAAFDTVSHDILLDRLNTNFGVSGTALQWLQSYLADRSQRVSINGVLSDRFEPRHGLPVRYRIDFKICLLTFKAIHGFAPSYLCELITVKESQWFSLRSSSELLLRMPSRITKNTLGDRAFQVAAPSLWNSLPAELRRKSDLEEFKRHLKAHLFSKAYL